jgi:hypothetical protein
VKYPGNEAVIKPTGGFIYPKPEKCIYCGEAPGTTHEHIIPKGLHGASYIQQGTCEACRERTGEFESFVLRKTLGLHRRALNFTSQNRKRRQKPLDKNTVAQSDDGSEEKIDLKNYPAFYLGMPIYDWPGMAQVMGLAKLYSVDKFHTMLGAHDAEQALSEAGGNRPITMPAVLHNKLKFAQFLGKMAHSLAMGVLGRDSFRPLLLNLILDGTGDPRMLIGGEPEIEPPLDEIFSIALGEIKAVGGRVFVGARIRLLSYLGMPTYIVIVGDGFHGDLLSVKNGAYALPVKISFVGGDEPPVSTL